MNMISFKEIERKLRNSQKDCLYIQKTEPLIVEMLPLVM